MAVAQRIFVFPSPSAVIELSARSAWITRGGSPKSETYSVVICLCQSYLSSNPSPATETCLKASGRRAGGGISPSPSRAVDRR